MKKASFFGWGFYLSLVFSPLFAQEPKTDPFTGVFSNADNGILLTLEAANAGTYSGQLTYQGKQYPATGIKVLGILTGEYSYNGNAVAFSLARIAGVYYLGSEGVTLQMERKLDTVPQAKPLSEKQSVEPAKLSITAATASGTRIKDPYGSYSFQTPSSDWVQTAENGGFQLKKNGESAQLGITAHPYGSLEEIRKNAVDVYDASSNTSLKAQVSRYGDKGLFIRFVGTVQGNEVAIETISLLSPNGGGVHVVGATQGNALPEANREALKSVANSVQFLKPMLAPIAVEWQQRIQGKQLLYLYTGNGFSEKATIDLCPSGAFYYTGDGSYTSGGYAQFSYAGQEANEGIWKVWVKNGQPVLVLFFNNNTITEYALSKRQAENEIGLNGKRYFVQGTSACR
jgi:hypothetical protein